MTEFPGNLLEKVQSHVRFRNFCKTMPLVFKWKTNNCIRVQYYSSTFDRCNKNQASKACNYCILLHPNSDLAVRRECCKQV